MAVAGLFEVVSVRLLAPGLFRGGGVLWTSGVVWAGYALRPSAALLRSRSLRPAFRSGPVSVPPVSFYSTVANFTVSIPLYLSTTPHPSFLKARVKFSFHWLRGLPHIHDDLLLVARSTGGMARKEAWP